MSFIFIDFQRRSGPPLPPELSHRAPASQMLQRISISTKSRVFKTRPRPPLPTQIDLVDWQHRRSPAIRGTPRRHPRTAPERAVVPGVGIRRCTCIAGSVSAAARKCVTSSLTSTHGPARDSRIACCWATCNATEKREADRLPVSESLLALGFAACARTLPE